jgi:hypothetical protein
MREAWHNSTLNYNYGPVSRASGDVPQSFCMRLCAPSGAINTPSPATRVALLCFGLSVAM